MRNIERPSMWLHHNAIPRVTTGVPVHLVHMQAVEYTMSTLGRFLITSGWNEPRHVIRAVLLQRLSRELHQKAVHYLSLFILQQFVHTLVIVLL